MINTSKIVTEWLLSSKHYSGSFAHTLPDETGSMASSKGRHRKNNQDRVCFSEITLGHERFTFYMLADGIGGGIDGDKCAAMAISGFIYHFTISSIKNFRLRIETAISRSSDDIYSIYKGEGGSTLSCLAFSGNGEGHIANAGDSGVFHYSKGHSGHLNKLTHDDTVYEKIKNVKDFDEKNINSAIKNSLAQFIGCGRNVNFKSQKAPQTPDKNPNFFVITSDGIHFLGSETMKKILDSSESFKEAASRMISVSEWLGGRDNASIIITTGPAKNIIKDLPSDNILLSQGGKDLIFSIEREKNKKNNGLQKKSAPQNFNKKNEDIEAEKSQLEIDIYSEDDASRKSRNDDKPE